MKHFPHSLMMMKTMMTMMMMMMMMVQGSIILRYWSP